MGYELYEKLISKDWGGGGGGGGGRRKKIIRGGGLGFWVGIKKLFFFSAR